MQAEHNELITRIGPGTACGALMRHYWQPVALLDEFDPRSTRAWRSGRSRRVRLLGQDLVLFRDARAATACSTATARIAAPTWRSARHEGDGLRCPFHGWKFAADGRCLETPAEPAGSTLCTRVRQRSYPLRRTVGRALRLARPRRLHAAARCRALRCFPSAGHAQLCVQGPVALQLAAGLRGRHRSGAPVVPAPLPARRDWHRRRQAYRAVSSAPPASATVDGERWPMTRVMRELCSPEIRHDEVAPGLTRLTALRIIDERADARARHACAVSVHLRDSAVGNADHHADARAGGRHAHLLVFASSPASTRRSTRRRCARSACAASRCPTTCRCTGRHNDWGFDRRGAAHAHLPRHGRGRHQPPRPVGGGKHGRDPGPHARAPGHQRQSHHGQPPRAAESDRTVRSGGTPPMALDAAAGGRADRARHDRLHRAGRALGVVLARRRWPPSAPARRGCSTSPGAPGALEPRPARRAHDVVRPALRHPRRCRAQRRASRCCSAIRRAAHRARAHRLVRSARRAARQDTDGARGG